MARGRLSKGQIKKLRERPLRFYVSFNQQEYDVVVRESRMAGVCRAAYVRAMTFQGQLIPRLSAEELGPFREMVSISNGLNELIKIAREKGSSELLPVFEQYREAMDTLLNRNRDVVQKLVKDYELIPAGKKNLRQTNFDALDNSETRKYAVFRSIQQCLPGCRDFDELEQRLHEQGVDTRYRVDAQTGQRVGISFRYQEESFKGSEIDRDYSFQRLAATLGQRQQLSQWESEKLVLGQAQDRQEQLARELAQRQQEELRQQEEFRHTHRQGHKLRVH